MDVCAYRSEAREDGDGSDGGGGFGRSGGSVASSRVAAPGEMGELVCRQENGGGAGAGRGGVGKDVIIVLTGAICRRAGLWPVRDG